MRQLSLMALVASSVYGAWFWLARDTGPEPDAFPPAARVIREQYRPTDQIFLVPFYATRAREHLGDLQPLAVRDPLAEDLEIHPRAWVFGIYGEGAALRERMTAAGLKLVSAQEPAPGITVDLYETGATQKTTYLFREHLKTARVAHEKDGTLTPCNSWSELNGQAAPMGGKWACPKDAEWFYVAPEWHHMGDTTRLCMWAHPPVQGRLLISFPNVPLSGRLYGRAGHTLHSSVNAHAPVSLDVQVGELTPQRFNFALTDYFRPFALVVPETGTATVTFGVSTPDNGVNHFCFDAEMRGAAQ